MQTVVLIYVVSLISFASCKTLNAPKQDSNELQATSAPDSADLIHVQAFYNGKFPQANTGIVLGMVDHLLNKSKSAMPFAQEPTASEIQFLGKAMNAFHKTNKVDERYREGGEPVADARLREIILGERVFTLLTVRRAIEVNQQYGKIFDAPWPYSPDDTGLSSAHRAHLAKDVDKALSHPQYAQLLRRMGAVIATVMDSAVVNTLATENKALKRDVSARKDLLKQYGMALHVNQVFRSQLYTAFSGTFGADAKKLGDAFVWDELYGEKRED